MRTRLALTLGLAMIAGGAMAQSAVDAYMVTPTQLRGSARFIGMGGAFTSLGGDLTCMTQNPAGLGIYRKSDIGLTFDISMRSYNSTTPTDKYDDSETRVKFDNFGYVGAVRLDNETMPFFQWGVGYNRIGVFDRMMSGYNKPTETSLTNYIAGYTNGVPSGDLLDEKGASYDPYANPDNDWLGVLAYNAFMINNGTGADDNYDGLFQNGTTGDALYHVRERGYTDEYNIDFAGNISDMFFWGIGVGIVDMDYTRSTYYSESMENALVYDQSNDGLGAGNAGFALTNYKNVSGTGANLKVGVIVRPIEMLRIGLAVHTPTWMHLTHYGYGEVDYNYTPYGNLTDRPTNSGYCSTPDFDYTSRLNTPWRFMAGASVMLGDRGVLSLDYERVAYNDMHMKQENFNSYLGGDYVNNTYANEDIKSYFKAANILRVGAEVRLNNHFAARAGFNYQSTNVKNEASDGALQIYTSGTDPSYRFDNDTYNICLGLGYRYKAWYVDLAYQHTRQTGTMHAYTPYPINGVMCNTPQASVTDKYNNIVISTGIRF